MPPGGAIGGLFATAPDSRTVVYRADQDTVGTIELYAAKIVFVIFADGFESQ